MADELAENVKKLVRSILQTEKHGLTESQLQGIYSEFVGGEIPYRKMGFQSLSQYLGSIPDAARRQSDGTYSGVANKETEHIKKLVQRQKTRKRPRISRRDIGGGYRGRGGGRGRGSSRGSTRGSSRGTSRGSSRGAPRGAIRGGRGAGSRSYNPRSSAASTFSRSLSDDRNPSAGHRVPPNPRPPLTSVENGSTQVGMTRQRSFPSENNNKTNFRISIDNSSAESGTTHQRSFPSENNNKTNSGVPRPPRGRGYRRGQPEPKREVPPRFRRRSSAEETFSEGSVESEEREEGVLLEDREDVAMDRISEILDSSAAGVYVADLPKIYKDRFHEDMEMDIIDKMAALDLCEKEQLLENHFIIYKKLSKPPPPERRKVVIRSPVVIQSPVVPPVNTRKMTTLDPPSSLPALTIPDEDFVEVLVSLIYDTSHFYCYIVGEEYSEKLSDLEDRMAAFYSDDNQLVLEEDPLVGHYYAVKSGKDWLRAMVETIEDGMALCRFADHGDKEEVELCNIRHLPKRFCVLPEQSIACRLAIVHHEKVSEAILKRFVFLAMSRSAPDKYCVAQITDRGDPLSVILYNETRCINDILMNILMLDRPV